MVPFVVPLLFHRGPDHGFRRAGEGLWLPEGVDSAWTAKSRDREGVSEKVQDSVHFGQYDPDG